MAVESSARRFAKDAKARQAWATAFYAEHMGYLAAAFDPCVATLSAILGRSLDASVVQVAARGYCERALAATKPGAYVPDQPLAETILHALLLESAP